MQWIEIKRGKVWQLITGKVTYTIVWDGKRANLSRQLGNTTFKYAQTCDSVDTAKKVIESML